MDGRLQAAETAREHAEQRAADARTDADHARVEAAAQVEETRVAADAQVSAHVTRQPGPKLKRGRRSSARTPTLPPSSAPLRRLATTPPVN